MKKIVLSTVDGRQFTDRRGRCGRGIGGRRIRPAFQGD